MRYSYLVIALALVYLAGCSQFLPQQTAPPEPALTETQPSSPAPATPTSPTPSPTPSGPLILTVWVPPQFDPDSGSQAGKLLKARLEEFSQRRPEVRVEVRIKAAEGPGGLLDSLTTASAAAPLALPDLIALSRPTLESAALKGLLHPYEGLSAAMEDSDWHEYARQLAHVQNSTFGLPFAGEALALVYRPPKIPTPPSEWEAVTGAGAPLVFPASDPQALFSLALYQSAGGEVRDAQGRPTLLVPPLTSLLDFYHKAEGSGAMPFWLTQYQGDDQAWQAFQEGRADMVATWTTRFLVEMTADTDLAPLPTSDGTAYTLANGWVWALASPQPDRQEFAAQLAEFLTESSFLSNWTQAAGYLPTRPSALEGWANASLKSVVNKIVSSAHIYPPSDVLTTLGPPVEGAVVSVLKQQSAPDEAAKQAVSSLPAP